ncbi:MAG TPA: S8 family serine peptidase [Symbiobacteriaceae bacterium]|nr:S8 family serine peptidase [Symbiobacteriaceae bacterium]
MRSLLRGWKALGLVLLLVLTLMPAAASAARSGRDYELTVVFAGGAIPAGAREKLEKAGAKVERTVPEVGVVQARGKASMIPALRQVAGVQYVAPSLTWKLQVERTYALAAEAAAAPGDLYDAYQWDIKQVTKDGASWRISKGSHRTTVGVIDSGINAQHQDLRANYLGGRNFVPAGTGGDPTETGGPDDVNDRVGHGSHVAGTIAGDGRIYGVGPNLGIRAYRVFGADVGAQTSWITAAMVAAARDRVDVISMSLGGYDVLGKVRWTDPDTGVTYDLGDDHADLVAWKRAFEYVSKQNIVVVAAAGNEAIDAGDPKAIVAFLNEVYGPEGFQFEGEGIEVPGGIRGAVAVSATGPDRSMASYSNYGKQFVAVAAPGGDFQRYPEGDWYTDMCLSADMDYGDGVSGYVFMAGTSMAAPKTAAAAALYIDQYRAKNRGRRPEPEVTIKALQRSATDLGRRGYDAYYGYGMVDVAKLLSGGREGRDHD